MKQWGELSDERYRELVDGEVPGVEAAAAMLRTYGLEPEVMATGWRDDLKGKGDGGDIIVPMRVEVKTLTRNFSDDQWPFKTGVPSRAAIIDHVHKLPEGRPPADLLQYIFVSADMKWCGIIPRHTRGSWFIHAMWDKNHGIARDYVWCPLDRIMFKRLTDG